MLALALALATAFTPLPLPPGTPRVVHAREFRLPFGVAANVLDRVRELRLYVSPDPAGGWRLLATETPPPAGPGGDAAGNFHVRLERDGRFSFAIMTVYSDGSTLPASVASLLADLRLTVDTRPRGAVLKLPEAAGRMVPGSPPTYGPAAPSALPHATAAPAPRAADGACVMETRDFIIPIHVHRAEDVARLRIFVSEDVGTSWKLHGEYGPGEGESKFSAPRDGAYWFALQIEDRRGQRRPAEDALRSELMVVVRAGAGEPSTRPGAGPGAASRLAASGEAAEYRARLAVLERRVSELESAAAAAELRALSGAWRVASIGGREFGTRPLKATALRIDGAAATLRVRGQAPDRFELQAVPGGPPGSVDLIGGDGRRMAGVYRLDGDELRVALAVGGGPRPSDLDAPGAVLCVLKRGK